MTRLRKVKVNSMLKSKMTNKKLELIEYMRDVVQNIARMGVTEIIGQTGVNYGTVYKYFREGGESLELTLFYIQKTYEVLRDRDLISEMSDMVADECRDDFMKCYSVEHFEELLFTNRDNV